MAMINVEESIEKSHILQFLLARGLISHDQIKVALFELQKQNIQDLNAIENVLLKLKFISEKILLSFKSHFFDNQNHNFADLENLQINPKLLQLVNKQFATEFNIFPMQLVVNQQSNQQSNQQNNFYELVIATENVNNLTLFDNLHNEVSTKLGFACFIKPVLATQSEIQNTIQKYYGNLYSLDDLINKLEHTTNQKDLDGTDENSAVVKLVNAILQDAVSKNASDIHFEPENNFLRIRYRIDGVLRNIKVLHLELWQGLAVRLKILSELDISKNPNETQDGRISQQIFGKNIDFRVSTHPTLYGDNIVLRILDRTKGIVNLNKLGLKNYQLNNLKELLKKPEGIILLTGPTGCGKTTTLYSMLQEIHNEGIHIMTLEDPVEYPMAYLRQTDLSGAKEFNFVKGIKSVLRQDPDVILIGEIRDSETASMAFRAAMTGHQVFSTLHCQTALAAVPRLLDLGLNSDILANNLSGVIAQRLLRKLCPHCKKAYSPSENIQKILSKNYQKYANTNEIVDSIKRNDFGEFVIYKNDGCEFCEMTGYNGRFMIMESIFIDEVLEDSIAENIVSKNKLKQRMLESENSKNKHYFSLADEGIFAVLSGLTSWEELERVVDISRNK